LDKPKPPAADGGGERVLESLNATLHKFRAAIHVGDRVKDRHSGRLGTCLFVGPADFAKGKEVCGLRLDKARTTTDCDGKYRGERHFRCTPGHGLYIPLEDAEFVGVADADDLAPPARGGGTPNPNPNPSPNPNPTPNPGEAAHLVILARDAFGNPRHCGD